MSATIRLVQSLTGIGGVILVALVFPRAQESTTPAGPMFTVPPGFEVERIAGPPLVDRPIVADFDDEGRLVRRGLFGIERPGREAARRPPASHRAARRHERRRPLRQERRLCRQDDVSRGDDVARRFALRRRAAEHLEVDRHRRRRRRRRARGVVQGQDADRLRQRFARAVPRPRRLDLLVQGRVCGADARAAGQAGARRPAPRTSSARRPDGTGDRSRS